MRHFELWRVVDPVTAAVRVRVTGLTIARDQMIMLEPDGYEGFRIEVSKSSGPVTASERDAAIDYAWAALAEYAFGGFGRNIRWSDILAVARG